jgi:hypothetical protein
MDTFRAAAMENGRGVDVSTAGEVVAAVERNDCVRARARIAELARCIQEPTGDMRPLYIPFEAFEKEVLTRCPAAPAEAASAAPGATP